MKTFAKEMWHLLVFAAALIAFNAGLTILFDSWGEWYGGELTLKSALFLTVVQVGLGCLALKTFEWLHKHVAETRGMKFFADSLQKHADGLKAEKAEQEAKLAEAQIQAAQFRVERDQALVNFEKSHHNFEELARRHETLKALQAAGQPVDQHFDDWALDQFVVQMRAKLAKKRDEGHSGWNDTQLDLLGDAFVEQIESMNASNTDMVDTANFAMFLWVRDAFPAECAAADPHAE